MGNKNKNEGPKHAKKHYSLERGGTYAGRGPWGGHACDQKEEKGGKERSQLESSQGKVEILESLMGSNTPEGQRPGELNLDFRRSRPSYT